MAKYWYLIELLSQGLTATLLYLTYKLLVAFWPLFKESLTTEQRKMRHDLVMGIFISFMGGGGDNIYWFVAWTFDFLGLPGRDLVFSIGTLPNLFFRQIPGIIALYLHTAAHTMSTHNSKIAAKIWLKDSALIGVVTMLILMGLKIYIGY